MDGETWRQTLAGTLLAINALFVLYLWAGLGFHRVQQSRYQRLRLISYFGTAALFALHGYLLQGFSLVGPNVTLLRFPLHVLTFAR